MSNAQLQRLLAKNGITLRGTRAAPKGVAPKAKGLTLKNRMSEQLHKLLPIGEAAPIVNHSDEGVIAGLNNNNNNNNNNTPAPNAPSLPWNDREPSVAADLALPPGVPLYDREGLNFLVRPTVRFRYNSLPTNPYRRLRSTEDGMGMGGYRRTKRTKRKSSMKKRK